MKKIKKILAAALVSTMLVSSVCAPSVFAASSDSGTVNGVSCYASIRYTTNSSGTQNGAVATTSYGASSDGIMAKATVYYYDKYNAFLSKTSGEAVNTIGGVSATASANGLGTVCGGKGNHYVKYGAYTWGPTTTIGKTSN